MRARSAYGKVNAQVQDRFQVGRQDRICISVGGGFPRRHFASDERSEVWWDLDRHILRFGRISWIWYVFFAYFFKIQPWGFIAIEPPFGRICFLFFFIALERTSPKQPFQKITSAPLKNYHDIGKSPCSIANTSCRWWFRIFFIFTP